MCEVDMNSFPGRQILKYLSVMVPGVFTARATCSPLTLTAYCLLPLNTFYRCLFTFLWFVYNFLVAFIGLRFIGLLLVSSVTSLQRAFYRHQLNLTADLEWTRLIHTKQMIINSVTAF